MIKPRKDQYSISIAFRLEDLDTIEQAMGLLENRGKYRMIFLEGCKAVIVKEGKL